MNYSSLTTESVIWIEQCVQSLSASYGKHLHGAQCVNLVPEDSVAEPFDVRCAFDEKHKEWLYVISMPEKDKAVLEEICKTYKIKVGDLIRQFYLWVIQEPETAAQWLKGETNQKKV